MKTLGIIGGLGPTATVITYKKLIDSWLTKRKRNYPPIYVYSVPQEFKIEKKVIENNGGEEEFLNILLEAVEILEKNSDIIIVPCNTAHSFLEVLRERSCSQIIDIIEATTKKALSNNLDNITIIGTEKTISAGFYQERLSGKNIIIPNEATQKRINRIIGIAVNNHHKVNDEFRLVCEELKKQGAESVIIACTDLSPLSNVTPFKKVVDSVEALVEESIEAIS